MKKIVNKIRRKTPEPAKPARITNDTVAEHREKVLAGGRKFKYPIQYSRHKLVINAIIIGVAALILIVAAGWHQLYVAQNTSEFMYRVTKLVPVPVASVDGTAVRYSDYLMKFRSNVQYLEKKEQVNLSTDDGKRRVAFIKQQALQDTISDAYVANLANELGLTVDDSEVEAYVLEQREAKGVQQQTYDAVILDLLYWTPDEYRHVLKSKLLRQKVAFAIDDTAKKANETVTAAITPEVVFSELAQKLTTESDLKLEYAATGWIPLENNDGGVTAAAVKLKPGEVVNSLKSKAGDGYYFIKLLDKNDKQVSYEYIKVPLTVLAERLDALKKSDTVRRFISVEAPQAN